MSYESDLAKLKRAAKSHAARLRRKLPDYGCCVCSARPAPLTRFGPRCEAHRPTPSPLDDEEQRKAGGA